MAKNRKKPRRNRGQAVTKAWPLFLSRLLPLVIVLGIGAGLWLGVRNALANDPGLAIRKITVEPAEGLGAAERGDLESKWIGRNILSSDLRQMARDLERNAAVRRARVTRRLPSEIHIEIQNRTPAAFIRFSPKGKLGIVSWDAVILGYLSKEEAGGLVVEAYGLGFTEPQPGIRIQNRGFVEAMKFLEAFEATAPEGREPLSRMGIDSLGNVTLVFGRGPEIRLGRKPSERLETLEKALPLLKMPERDKIEYLDLQFDQVILKRKK